MQYDAMKMLSTGELPEHLREASPEAQRPGAQLAAVTQSNAQPNAQPEAERAEQQASEPDDLVSRALRGGNALLADLATGVAERATRSFVAFEGGREALGLGVAEGFQGVNQIHLWGLEKLGLAEPGTAERFNAMTNEQREIVSRNLEQKFGKDLLVRGAVAVARGGGRSIPAAVATGPVAGAVLPAGGAVAASAGRAVGPAIAGAVEGATEYAKDSAERGFNTLVGLSTGVLGPAFEVVPFIRERGRRFVSGILDDAAGELGGVRRSIHARTPSELHAQAIARRKEIMEEGLDLQSRTGINLKADQIDPDVVTETVMGLARKSPKVEATMRFIEENQPGQVREFLNTTIDQLGQGSRGRFGTRVADAFDTVLGDATRGTGMLGRRAAQAKADFAAVAKAQGGAESIPLDNYLGELDRILAQSGKRGATTKQIALANEAREMVDKITKGGTDKAIVGADDLQNLLAEYGAASRSSSKIFQNIEQAAQRHETRTLFGALKRDLDAAIDAGVPGSAELKTARDNYKAWSQKIEALDDSVLGKLFGGSKTRPAESVEKEFLAMDADTMRSTIKVLGRADPELQKGLQAFWLENAMTRASRSGPVTMGEGGTDAVQMIPGKFLELRDGAKGKQFDAVFPDDAFSNASGGVRERVLDALAISSRIVTNNQRTGGKTATRLKDLAGVLASRDNTFIARLGAEILAPNFLSKIVVGDPDVIRALHTFTTPYSPVEWSVALTAISNHLREQGMRNPEEIQPAEGKYDAFVP